MKARSIYYVQYTNPACYPPLEHSARLLNERGWAVTFLGKEIPGETSIIRFPADLAVREIYWKHRRPGLAQKVHYAAFCLHAVWRAVVDRPSWVYCSDLLSCPVAWLVNALTSIPVVYHEHDGPALGEDRTAVGRILMRLRSRIGRCTDLVILPNAERLTCFQRETARTGKSFCVFNVPSEREVVEAGAMPAREELSLVYQGSINDQRLPLTILQGMRRSGTPCTLTIIGYETGGSRGYVSHFLAEAARLGLGNRVQACGAMPRKEMMNRTGQGDVGLAFMPMQTTDPNMAHMEGASNKPFDYLACGLALLVSDLPGWRKMYIEPGHGLSCDPRSPDSIAEALRQFSADRRETRAMGERGRQRILVDWNYRAQFESVMTLLNQ